MASQQNQVVVVEFLGSEPIENVITCMHYKVDKVIFFGYQEVIDAQKETTQRFLRETCGVETVVFHAMSHHDLQAVLKEMRVDLERERSMGNQIYFDITGGESLVLVAFGMLSGEFDTPIHLYDIEQNRMVELDDGNSSFMSKEVPEQQVEFNIDKLIRLRGGIVNYQMQKAIKNKQEQEILDDFYRVWRVASKYWKTWMSFTDFFRCHMHEEAPLQYGMSARELQSALIKYDSQLKRDQVYQILQALAAEGMLIAEECSGQKISYRFKNEFAKASVWESGNILEMYVFREQREINDDCHIGVHIDWDGIIHKGNMGDVLNEIDVLTLQGVVPTFYSCKSGKMSGQQVTHALYELETIATKFGGRYAKKVLVTMYAVPKAQQQRAQEMHIEIRTLGK